MAVRPSEGVRSRTALVGALALLAALLVLPLALAPSAEAYVYWTNSTATGGTIGRSELDGSDVNPRFIAGAGNPVGLALDAKQFYWTDYHRDGIRRANLDATGVEQSFISAFNPKGVAVDAEHLYWTWSECEGGCATTAAAGGIGRANLDGKGVEQSFIGGVNPIAGDGSGYVAVDAQHIYWIGTFCEGKGTCSGDGTDRPVFAIGRANLNGTGVDRSFIVTGHTVTRPTTGGSGTVTYPTGVFATGLAVDGEHIYWTGRVQDPCCGATLGRANLDGTGVDQSFIGGPCCLYPPSWTGVAVDDAHIYWASHERFERHSIRRANLDGSGLAYLIAPDSDNDFNPGGAIAVDALTDTKADGKASAARTQRQTGKRIVVKVKVKANERLTVKARGKIKVNPTYKLEPQKVKLAAGARKLKLKPGKADAKKVAAALKRGHRATAKLSVKLSDVAGNSASAKLRVRLIRG
jgi:hypothetical protein